MNLLEKAIIIAAQGHQGQVDKAGEPYSASFKGYFVSGISGWCQEMDDAPAELVSDYFACRYFSREGLF